MEIWRNENEPKKKRNAQSRVEKISKKKSGAPWEMKRKQIERKINFGAIWIHVQYNSHVRTEFLMAAFECMRDFSSVQ